MRPIIQQNFVIQIVPDAELDCFAQVIRDSFRDVAGAFGLTRDNCPSHTSFLESERLRQDRRNGHLIFGAYADGAPVGCVSIKEIGDGVWELDHLAVLPAYRHQGAGRLLLDRCVREAKRHDATAMKIGIIEENVRLKNWYAGYGFHHSGTARFPNLPFTVGFMTLDIH